MAKPLTSEEIGQPKSMQFAHFGVLNDGVQSKGSTLSAIVINVLLAFVIVVVGAASKQTIDNRRKLTELTTPVLMKKIEPVKPKFVPDKPPPPKLPDVPKIQLQTARIIIPPPVKLPDVPKTPVVKMDAPKPVLTPTPPKVVVAMAAPQIVSLGHPSAASVVNHDAHPSAVRLGNPNSPVNPTGPATAAASINFARGMPGMNAANTGSGPAASKVNFGNGSPESSSIHGTGVKAVQGVKLGVPGGTPNSTARVAGPVNLAQATPPPMPKALGPISVAQRVAPKVVFKPKPTYSAEALQMHLEGVVSIRIRVLPSGGVEVIGVTSGLGHGLDESAIRAVQATRFLPATDAAGNPIAWDGVVNVAFQLAG